MNRWLLLVGVLVLGFGWAGCSEPGSEPGAESPAERPAAGPPPADQSDESPPAEAPAAEEPQPESAAKETPTDEPPEQEDAAAGGDSPSPSQDDSAAKDNSAAKPPLAPEIRAGYWLNTAPLTLADLRGKIVVLEFWATWCGPCLKTIPHLIKIYKKYKDKGVAFVSLTNEPRRKVEPFVEKMKMPYPIGGSSPTGRAYGVRGIPHAFIIDPSGKVVAQGHPMGGLEQALKRQLKKTPPTE